MGRSESIVACGVSDVTDDWHFGNFLAICSMLKSLLVDGLFISTFPLATYFESYDTIKFGKHWNGDALIAYDKATFEEGSLFWTQCDMDHSAPGFIGSVLSARMEVLLGQLGEDDALNLYLLGHGNEKGMLLGSKMLQWKRLSNMIARSNCKANINIFVQSCHSGKLIELLKGNPNASLLCNTSAKARQVSFADSGSISLKFRFDPDTVAWTLSGYPGLLRREGGTTATAKVCNFTTKDLQTALDQAMFAELDCGAGVSPAMVRHILTPPQTSIPSSPSVHRLEEFAHGQLKDVIHACETEADLVGDPPRELDIALITPIFSGPYRFAKHDWSRTAIQGNIRGPRCVAMEVLRAIRHPSGCGLYHKAFTP